MNQVSPSAIDLIAAPPHDPMHDAIIANGLLSSQAQPIVRTQRWFEAEIGSVGDLVRIVECCHTGSHQYRGQDSDVWELKPKLTRDHGPAVAALDIENGETWQDKEQHILADFRGRMSQYGGTPDSDALGELELAIWAQHHEVPTRMLDWTLNPLAALFFAVADERDCSDAVVWSLAQERTFVTSSEDLPRPECGVRFVLPPKFFQRAAVQSSILAVWGDPRVPMLDLVRGNNTVWKIVIPAKRRACIRWGLYCLGITRETLFPGLDGLGRYLSWKHGGVHEPEYRRNCRPASSTSDMA